MNELFPVEAVTSQGPQREAARPMMSRKRIAILDYVTRNTTISLVQAVALVGSGIYCNAEKHTGAVLSNMVKVGLLKRLKPGLFAKP